MSEPELRDRIAVLLGGRSAEEIVFGFATTGAQDDLKRATDIARRMVTEFGMSEKVGPINITIENTRFLTPAFRAGEQVSDETEVAIDREVKAILLEAREVARRIIAERRDDMDRLAELLLEKESLDRRDLDDHFGARVPAPERDRATVEVAPPRPGEAGDADVTVE
jgi:cell division protease FtsH